LLCLAFEQGAVGIIETAEDEDAPALGHSARQKAEMPARHQAPMNPEKPARFK
jgi:hypothetical protein